MFKKKKEEPKVKYINDEMMSLLKSFSDFAHAYHELKRRICDRYWWVDALDVESEIQEELIHVEDIAEDHERINDRYVLVAVPDHENKCNKVYIQAVYD